MAQVESKIQQACVNWFRDTYPEKAPLLFSVPNGGLRDGRTCKTLEKEGLWAGVSDLILLLPNEKHHALCIEMKKESFDYKAGKEKITRTYAKSHQREWGEAVKRQGYAYEIVRSLDEFKKLIVDYTGEDRESFEYFINHLPE